jgi:phage tail-like protein
MKSDDIGALLPAVFRSTLQGNNPATALLQLMEWLHQPSEDVLAGLDSYFDPRRTPDRFVPYLACLLDLDRFLPREAGVRTVAGSAPVPVTQLREWIAGAVQIGRLRGTAKGLRMLLEVATGITGFEIQHEPRAGENARAFHLRVRAPASAKALQALIERIVDREKPAYMTFDRVEFDAISDGKTK